MMYERRMLADGSMLVVRTVALHRDLIVDVAFCIQPLGLPSSGVKSSFVLW